MTYLMSFFSDIKTRPTVINSLAIVGFITLITLGISLAVYSSRYVPNAIGSLGAAAVSLSQIFTSAEPTLTVVPTDSTTLLPFGDMSSTTDMQSASAPADTTPKNPAARTAGEKTSTTYQIGGATGATPTSGLPDLTVSINAVGYLTTASADSFIASSTVPAGSRPAVNFTIKNIGAGITGAWRFSASIPTQSAYIYQSQSQQSLGAGDSIEYTLGFDQSNKGTDQMISITANFDHTVGESNTNNNSAATKITVLGS
ncbi:MAG: hypothetical protein NT108_03430 [Candidatus Kaiserbacteria bacterium]|nr:hypothetical protein [Candidatus Kaiserbacteria bacterium]